MCSRLDHPNVTYVSFPHSIYPFLVIALGYLALGVTGFASALICVPLLAWHWPLVEVVPLVLMTDLTASILMGGLNLPDVHWRELGYLLPGVAAGALLGLGLSSRVHSAWPLLVLGLYVAGVGVQALRVRTASQRNTVPNWQGGPFGFLIGLVEILFATAGPLMLAWLARRHVDARGMRASVPAFAAIGILPILTIIALDGRLSTPVIWLRYASLAPVALVAVVLGHLLARRLPVNVLRTSICGLLVLSGAMLALNALRTFL